MIAIIDYDAGNTASVTNAFRALGEETVLTDDKNIIASADRVVLPGVGAFGDAMKRLRERGLECVIRDVVEKGTPFLGICLGMQLLFEESEESPGVKGLSLLSGTIRRFEEADGLKIPQIGWNDLQFPRATKLFHDVRQGSHVYFVHSYHLPVEGNESVIAATARYGCVFGAAVEKENLMACQFHPEKSADVGRQILANFLSVSPYPSP